MDSLEAELERARSLSVSDIADAIETIGFECTRCGACCQASGCDSADSTSGCDSTDSTSGCDSTNSTSETDAHTATVFPDEVRQLQENTGYDWRDVARPMPYGLSESESGPVGETFEWALQTDSCGDCAFYDAGESVCTVYEDRPLICRTYPFSVALGGTSQPMGEAVDQEGVVRAHECEGLGRDIDRADADALAATLKARAVRELEEAIAVRDAYEPTATDGVVVHDSEGAKRPDGTPY